MQLLIKKARIIDPASSFNGKLQDILIEDGRIKKIGASLRPDAPSGQVQVLEQPGLHVSPGWVDLFAHFCDPGMEYREDIRSGSLAAAAGGYTDVMLIPDTSPCLQSKAQITYVLDRARPFPVSIHPIGAVSRSLEGSSLAEMYEMHQSGAVAFSDGLHPIQSSGLLLKALQYVKAFEGTIIQLPDDTSISRHGLMHEGIHSTRLGMPGKPALAEDILVQRDIELTRYAGSKIHFTGISTRKSIALIAAAKKEGLAVSCSVTPYHLLLTDAALEQYDSNLKVNPPLRNNDDVQALREAVENGTVDCIATHHLPRDRDSKQKEFEYAGEGMIGLESCFGLLREALPGLSADRLAQLLGGRARELFGLPSATLQEDAPACLTFFDPEKEWVFDREALRSKSANTPFLGRTLKGKPLGIYNKQQLHLLNP
uniref:Dihydroorotase n=1 Tax=Compostibacter hankyongensis TaxID=1007089 RepID=A0ABP8FPS7_9BACT